MQVELSNLHQELGITFVMVTHDQEEALSLSNRIAVMNDGKLEQVGTPNQIYEYPQTPFVADFIGDTNLFQGEVESSDISLLQVITEKGLKLLVKNNQVWNGSVPKQIIVSLRPEKIHLSLSKPTSTVNCFEARLKHTMYLGTHVHYMLELPTGDRLTVMQPNKLENLTPDPHIPIYVHWSATDCLALVA